MRIVDVGNSKSQVAEREERSDVGEKEAVDNMGSNTNISDRDRNGPSRRSVVPVVPAVGRNNRDVAP